VSEVDQEEPDEVLLEVSLVNVSSVPDFFDATADGFNHDDDADYQADQGQESVAHSRSENHCNV
jgi:hypothetical protein